MATCLAKEPRKPTTREPTYIYIYIYAYSYTYIYMYVSMNQYLYLYVCVLLFTKLPRRIMKG